MHLRDFRIGWRLLASEPGYSAAVILSLAVGFASCFLLLGFVRYSFSYDSDVPQGERIVLVKMRNNSFEQPIWSESVPLAFLAPVRASGMTDGVTAVVPLPVGMSSNATPQAIELAAVHTDFPAMFGVRALAGDLRLALSRPDTLALTSSSATRLFGQADAVGKVVRIAGKPYTVAALIADRPANSTLSYGALAGIDSAAWDQAERQVLMSSWGYINGAKIYARLKPGVSADSLRRYLQRASDDSPYTGTEPRDKSDGRKPRDMALGALPGLYFDTDTANTPNSGPHGDLRAMLGLTAVALLILALAAVNYANLATVRTLRRQREIAVRKVLGAHGWRLLAQFLAESLLVAMSATALGLLLAWVLLPLFADLVDRRLDGLFTPAALVLNLALGAVIGLLAGAYPAWVALRVRPPQALAGRGGAETAGALWLRRVLTVLQFATAMALVAVTLTVAWQTRYASQANPGFDPSPLLVLELPTDAANPAAHGLREALRQLPGVDGVATSIDPIGRPFAGAHIKVTLKNGRWSSLSIRAISADFFAVHGLRPVAGRLLGPNTDNDEGGFESVVLNARAARALGYTDPAEAVGQILSTDSGNSGDGKVSATIVGIAPDVRYDSLREAPKSYLYFTSRQGGTLTVRTHGDLGELEGAAQALATRYFPNDVVPVRQARSYFALNYGDDLRLAKLLGLASAIAVMIAGFGVYVLAAYNIRRLGRQIVLRKLFGARRRDIARLVSRDMLVLLALSAAIGLPLAALANQRYLAPFIAHAPIGAWTLLAGLLAAVAVTLVSTLRGTLTAIGMSPALVLRDE